MKYAAVIRSHGGDELFNCFKPEEFKDGRSKVAVKREKGFVLFTIDAEDATALRAAVHGVTKLLSVYEKMKVLDG